MIKIVTIKILLLLSLFFSASTWAAEEKQSNSEQIIQPKVVTQDISISKIDTEDFEVGAFFGLYTSEDFGSAAVQGINISYHVTEGLFVEATLGRTTLNRTSAEKQFNFDTLSGEDRELTYTSVMLGWNMLPGETYFGDSWAFPMALYLVSGIATTDFAGEDRATAAIGLGYRLLITDYMAFHLDFRLHSYKVVVLTEERTTKNTLMHTGVSFFF